jgi:hypothetical protein
VILLWLLLAAAGLYGLHRLALWMEGRGWIFYRKQASSTARGAAFLEVQKLFEPNRQHVVDAKLQQRVERDDAGGPPPGLLR